jgi:hypothetical protein
VSTQVSIAVTPSAVISYNRRSGPLPASICDWATNPLRSSLDNVE